LGGQAGDIGNRVSALPIFDCCFSAMRAELDRNKVVNVGTSIDAAVATKSRFLGQASDSATFAVQTHPAPPDYS
jgi:hypothetical protein